VAVESSVRLRVDGSSAVRELNRVNKATGALQGAVGKLLGGFAAVDLARRFFQGFAEADKAAAAVRTLGVDSEVLRRELLGVSNELEGLVSQTELTTAAYDVASAGFTDAAGAANILKAASLGAVGGLADLNTVADATTSVLNAYGLSSDKAAKLVDGFIQTQNDGKIVVAQYAQQIGRVAPIAAAAGVGIDELNAAISTVTAQGVPIESTFAGLRQVIASVIKPTDEASKAAEALGIDFSSAAIKTKGFGGFLEEVVQKTGGSEVALTKLFGSVEALAAILPLTNDGLVSFNDNLDNQANSAGAAEKATEDLGGTVTSQVTKIINNIGNVARALDKVLGPALKFILQDLNNIISAASTAISKFTDLATGAVSRAAASLQALTSTGFANEAAFVALKESIGTLRPELAQSETDLLKLEGALDEAGRAALRFSGKGDFGRLRNDVLDTITAMRQLIINRREALGKGSGTGGTPIVTDDPEVLALRARIERLLSQLDSQNNDKGSGLKVDPLASLKGQIEQLKLKNALAAAGTEEERAQAKLLFDIGQLTAIRTDDNATLVDQAIKLTGKLAFQNQQNREAKRIEEERARQAKVLNDLYEQVGNTISTAIVDSLMQAKSATEALSGVLNNVANQLLQLGVNTLLKSTGLGIFSELPGFANGGRPPVGRPSIVGERGPELFVPDRAGTIVPNHAIGGANVTVNVDASGSSVEGNADQASQLGKAIGIAVQQELVKQKRPGGLLAS
jgi:TP901 family phage tail tape measure protein